MLKIVSLICEYQVFSITIKTHTFCTHVKMYTVCKDVTQYHISIAQNPYKLTHHFVNTAWVLTEVCRFIFLLGVKKAQLLAWVTKLMQNLQQAF